MAQWLPSAAERRGVFEALRDETAFEAVMVIDGAVSWPNGLDLAPDAMYDAIKESGVLGAVVGTLG